MFPNFPPCILDELYRTYDSDTTCNGPTSRGRPAYGPLPREPYKPIHQQDLLWFKEQRNITLM